MSEAIDENFEIQQRFWVQLEEASIPVDTIAPTPLRVFLTAEHIRTGRPRLPLNSQEVGLDLLIFEKYNPNDYEQSA